MKSNYQKMNEAMERDGDADDDYLNYVEKNLILPKMEQYRLSNITCKAEKKVLEECRNKYTYIGGIPCFFSVFYYALCLTSNRGSADVQDDCTEEYLALRSKYRLTKDPAVLLKLKSAVFPYKYAHSDP